MRRPLALFPLALAALLALPSGTGLAADPPVKRPPGSSLVMPEREKRAAHKVADLSSLRRLVKEYDFEDAERFPAEMPRDWFRLSPAADRVCTPRRSAAGIALASSSDVARGSQGNILFGQKNHASWSPVSAGQGFDLRPCHEIVFRFVGLAVNRHGEMTSAIRRADLAVARA